MAIRLLYTAELGGLTVSLSITNHSKQAVAFELAWHVATDFADIQEAQSGRREQDAAIDVDLTATSVVFQCRHP